MRIGTILWGGGALLAGLAVILFGWWVMHRAIAFAAIAVPGTGEVVAVEYNTPERFQGEDLSRSRSRQGSYTITLRYTTEAGETLTGTSFANPAESLHEVGEQAPILYDPDRPERMRIRTEEYPLAAFGFFALVGGIFAAIGAYLLWSDWRRWRAVVARRRAA